MKVKKLPEIRYRLCSASGKFDMLDTMVLTSNRETWGSSKMDTQLKDHVQRR